MFTSYEIQILQIEVLYLPSFLHTIDLFSIIGKLISDYHYLQFMSHGGECCLYLGSCSSFHTELYMHAIAASTNTLCERLAHW